MAERKEKQSYFSFISNHKNEMDTKASGMRLLFHAHFQEVTDLYSVSYLEKNILI
jgi:hypothetical protein